MTQGEGPPDSKIPRQQPTAGFKPTTPTHERSKLTNDYSPRH